MENAPFKSVAVLRSSAAPFAQSDTGTFANGWSRRTTEPRISNVFSYPRETGLSSVAIVAIANALSVMLITLSKGSASTGEAVFLPAHFVPQPDTPPPLPTREFTDKPAFSVLSTLVGNLPTATRRNRHGHGCTAR